MSYEATAISCAICHPSLYGTSCLIRVPVSTKVYSNLLQGVHILFLINCCKRENIVLHTIHQLTHTILKLVWFMVFNTTFNNISVISWWSVLLVEETGVPGENHVPVASHWQTLSHNVVSNIPHLSGIRTHNVCGDRYWLHR